MMVMSGLEKSYDGRPAIADFSLDVQDDEYLTILGPSGSGKSTLLRLIAGLDRLDSGSITLNGEAITGKPSHLRGLGFVQQTYALFPHMSVRDNVSFGLRYRLVDPVQDEHEVARRCDAMLELVGLSGLGDRMVGQISGGQKQRVSLARTLVTEPKICLLDEPLGALDANLRERMTIELRHIRATLGVTFMHVTGNEAEALTMGDRLIVLDQGRAIQVDTPDRLFTRPATVAVAKLVNNYNILPGRVEGGGFQHGDSRLALPEPAQVAGYYVIRFDQVAIGGIGEEIASGMASMEAAFIASEFMGSRVIYFFRRPDGGVFEVERHLSRDDPEDYAQGETCALSWPLSQVLLYGGDGRLLDMPAAEGRLQ
ncbi:ABC transporter ATP-binding protein [Pelagibius sp. Alg239-R121]|uniref:ABC transporter ATP-binding protein n=1 Tax=Pelagibius sp. Alg239-R121 TaxID=2993448 RepID=UPI0024A7546E|nr:ABC transporter ATP-binding protein [Pelagibius sp. Alg239-R121]